MWSALPPAETSLSRDARSILRASLRRWPADECGTRRGGAWSYCRAGAEVPPGDGWTGTAGGAVLGASPVGVGCSAPVRAVRVVSVLVRTNAGRTMKEAA